MSADCDVKTMQDAGDARIEVEQYHKGRGEVRSEDVHISRPAGIVSAREDNSRELASFRGSENISRRHGRN